jgi:hypothetical protein
MSIEESAARSGIEAAFSRALDIRALYEILEQRINGKV